MFDKDWLYYRKNNFLTAFNQLCLNLAYISTTTGAKLRNMFNNFVRFFNHLKSSAFVSRLASWSFTTGFPKTSCLWCTSVIMTGRNRTVAAVFWIFESVKTSFQICNYVGLIQNNFI